MRSRVFWLMFGMSMLLLLGACGGSGRESSPDLSIGVVTATAVEGATQVGSHPPLRYVSEACNRAFAEAAATRDLWHTVENLFPALNACDSLMEWMAASSHNRRAIVNDVDPVRFANTACKAYEEASSAPVCNALGY